MPKKKQKSQNEELNDFIKAATPLVNVLNPLVNSFQEANKPVLRRAQWMNFIIMISLIIIIGGLAYTKIIDGSAATGLIGAIVGYVFGHIYSNKGRK
jgi:hypothetical protein